MNPLMILLEDLGLCNSKRHSYSTSWLQKIPYKIIHYDSSNVVLVNTSHTIYVINHYGRFRLQVTITTIQMHYAA